MQATCPQESKAEHVSLYLKTLEKFRKRPPTAHFDVFACLQAKNVGLCEQTLEPHICKLSRDVFNFSRDYFPLWVITCDLLADSSPVVSYAKILFLPMIPSVLSSRLKTDSKDDWGRVRFSMKRSKNAFPEFF